MGQGLRPREERVCMSLGAAEAGTRVIDGKGGFVVALELRRRGGRGYGARAKVRDR